MLRGRDSAEINAEGKLKESDARTVMDVYAACVVKHRYLRVKKALKLAPGGQDQRKSLTDVSTNECLDSGTLGFSAPLLRGALYKALVRRELAVTPVTVPAEPLHFTASDEWALGEVAKLTFAQCLYRREPGLVHDLLFTQASSAAERAVLGRITPLLQACVEPTNQLAFTKAELVGLLAEVYYRSVAPSAPENQG